MICAFWASSLVSCHRARSEFGVTRSGAEARAKPADTGESAPLVEGWPGRPRRNDRRLESDRSNRQRQPFAATSRLYRTMERRVQVV